MTATSNPHPHVRMVLLWDTETGWAALSRVGVITTGTTLVLAQLTEPSLPSVHRRLEALGAVALRIYLDNDGALCRVIVVTDNPEFTLAALNNVDPATTNAHSDDAEDAAAPATTRVG